MTRCYKYFTPYGAQNRQKPPYRTFAYSSVSRLLSAENPESGTITYSYDRNGNLTHKQDARGVDTSYVYDKLNRPTTRSYDDGTPTVTYTYDGSGVTFGKGRLASVSSTVSTTSYTKYDATGKLLESSQTTDGLAVCSGSSAACLMTYKYNLAGALTEETYPSGRVVHHMAEAAGSGAGGRGPGKKSEPRRGDRYGRRKRRG